jgi:hypothetical protein
LGVIVVVALGVGLRLFSFCSAVFPGVSRLDAGGDFLLCVYNAEPYEFFGRWVFSVESGRRWGESLHIFAPPSPH